MSGDFAFYIGVPLLLLVVLWFFHFRDCDHERTSFPSKSPGDEKHHVTCLGCGAEFDYNWTTMTRGGPRGNVVVIPVPKPHPHDSTAIGEGLVHPNASAPGPDKGSPR